MPLYLNYCSSTLMCHTVNDYWAFLYEADYGGYLHFFYCFLAMLFCHIGMPKRQLGWFVTGLYVFCGAAFYSVVAELSIVIWGSADGTSPIGSKYFAGKPVFDLLNSIVGILFGMLFLWGAGAVPNTVFVNFVPPASSTPSEEEQSVNAPLIRKEGISRKSGISRKAKVFLRSQIINFLLWCFLVPISVMVVGEVILHYSLMIKGADYILRLDFLFWGLYMNLVAVVVVWLIRGNLEVKHLCNNIKALAGPEAFVYPPNVPVNKREKEDKNKVSKRIRGEFILLALLMNLMFLWMMFNWSFAMPFYIATYPAVGLAGLVFLVGRPLLGMAPVQLGYSSPLPHMGSRYSVTESIGVSLPSNMDKLE